MQNKCTGHDDGCQRCYVDGFGFLPSKSFSVDVFRPEKLEISHSTVSVGSTSGFCEAKVSYSPFQRLKRHLTNYKNFKIRIASDNHSNIFFLQSLTV